MRVVQIWRGSFFVSVFSVPYASVRLRRFPFFLQAFGVAFYLSDDPVCAWMVLVLRYLALICERRNVCRCLFLVFRLRLPHVL